MSSAQEEEQPEMIRVPQNKTQFKQFLLVHKNGVI